MAVMKIIPALLTLIFATALTTRADVISQTLDFGTFNGGQQYYFNQFNTSLGTLTGVTLDWTINSSITSASVTNENTGTVTLSKISFTNSVDGYVPSVGDSGPLVAEVLSGKTVSNLTGNKTLTNGQSYTLHNIAFNTFNQTDTYTTGDDSFNSFKGTGSVPIYLTNTFGATPTATGSGSTTTSWLTSITGSTSGNLQVTYTYNAAPAPIAPVPEPPSLILGFGGILGMAAFAFKRRTKTAAAELV